MANEAFPYFTALHVNDCFTYRDFDIPIGVGEDKPFRHLILTGRNGSGKTTILRGINDWMVLSKNNGVPSYATMPISPMFSEGKQVRLEKKIVYPMLVNNRALHSQDLYALFGSRRQIDLGKVSTVISETDFEDQVSKNGISNLLKQFLVNRKVNQAFDIIEKNGKPADEKDKFFDNLEAIFQEVLEDKGLKLIFARKEFEFYLQYGDGREVTFNQLSDGFSAFIGILLELLVRVNVIQTQQKNNTLNPPGIVLIDEPESHLHLELQYQIMPLLTRLFPNIQFIIATHSPAVVSSIKNATVFDLTTKSVAKDWVVGSSFSELMTVHFGLEDEFSNIADKIMADAQQIADSKVDTDAKLVALKKLFTENERYLSPAFHLAMESQILRLKKTLVPT